MKAEVANIRRVVENLQMRVGNVEGYSNKIDHLMKRMPVIEKHPALNRGWRHKKYFGHTRLPDSDAVGYVIGQAQKLR